MWLCWQVEHRCDLDQTRLRASEQTAKTPRRMKIVIEASLTFDLSGRHRLAGWRWQSARWKGWSSSSQRIVMAQRNQAPPSHRFVGVSCKLADARDFSGSE